MSINESDLQAMDGVIDQSASTDESQRVEQLVADPSVAELMRQMRANRDARKTAIASLEPDDVTLERFHWRLSGAIADAREDEISQRKSSVWGLSRVGSVSAACVVLGFFGGWLGRGQPTATPVNSVAHVGQPSNPSHRQGQLTPVANITLSSGDIMVPVSNQYGQVVAWQRFHNSQDARQFTEDMNHANNPGRNDHVKLMSGEQY